MNAKMMPDDDADIQITEITDFSWIEPGAMVAWLDADSVNQTLCVRRGKVVSTDEGFIVKMVRVQVNSESITRLFNVHSLRQNWPITLQ